MKKVGRRRTGQTKVLDRIEPLSAQTLATQVLTDFFTVPATAIIEAAWWEAHRIWIQACELFNSAQVA